jgi:hypothetical protein
VKIRCLRDAAGDSRRQHAGDPSRGAAGGCTNSPPVTFIGWSGQDLLARVRQQVGIDVTAAKEAAHLW